MSEQGMNRLALRMRSVSAGRRLHGVPDKVVGADLMGQLGRHVSPDWYAVIFFSDGRGVCMPQHPGVTPPAEAVINWLAMAAAMLNAQLHSGGHWIVAWSDRQEPVLVWRDGEGDIHLAVEVDCKAEALEDYGSDRVLDFAAKALAEAGSLLSRLELAPRQQINLAQVRASRH